MQWGYKSLSFNVSFPIAFPTINFVVFLQDSGSAESGAQICQLLDRGRTKTGFIFFQYGADNSKVPENLIGAFFLAIGK